VADLAGELLDSLETEPADDPEVVDALWADEIGRRAVGASAATGEAWEMVRDRLRAKLARDPGGRSHLSVRVDLEATDELEAALGWFEHGAPASDDGLPAAADRAVEAVRCWPGPVAAVPMQPDDRSPAGASRPLPYRSSA